MPADRDQVGHRWYHVDARAGDSDEGGFWYCLHCKHEWPSMALDKVSLDDTETNPLPKPYKAVKLVSSQANGFAIKSYFRSRAEAEIFHALVTGKQPWPTPKGLTAVQLGHDGEITFKFVDTHAAIAFAKSVGHEVYPAKKWPKAPLKRTSGPHDIRVNMPPGDIELVAKFTNGIAAHKMADLLHLGPDEDTVERATLALLGKQEKPDMRVDWVASREMHFSKWKEQVRKALEAVWTQ